MPMDRKSLRIALRNDARSSNGSVFHKCQEVPLHLIGKAPSFENLAEPTNRESLKRLTLISEQKGGLFS